MMLQVARKLGLLYLFKRIYCITLERKNHFSRLSKTQNKALKSLLFFSRFGQGKNSSQIQFKAIFKRFKRLFSN